MEAPEKGFYYHYKHDASKGITDHAYEVIGLGWHTENNTYQVIYKPLYENEFLGPAEYCLRPEEMFSEVIEKEGRTFPRFQKIEDANLIAELEKSKKSLAEN